MRPLRNIWSTTLPRMKTISFTQLEGKTITRFDGSKTVLHLAGKPIRLHELTLRQQTLSVLMDPNMSFIIFALGLLCIFFEFNHPGAILPGVMGFIAVAFHSIPCNCSRSVPWHW